MKKLLLSASVAVAVICFTSCDKLKELIPPFDITLPDVPVVINAVAASTNEVSLGTGTQNYDINAEIKKYAASANINNVSSVKLKSVNISMPGASEPQNLSNFSSLRIALFSNSNTSEATLANASLNNNFTTQATAIPTDVELKSYLSGSTYTYTVKGIVRKAITTPTSIIVSATVTIKP